MAKGWFRRKKGKLTYYWTVEDPATGRMTERSKVIGPETMPDEEGWQQVGVLKQKGEINTDGSNPSLKLTFHEIAAYYLANKEWRKQSTKNLHTQVINGLLVPRWGGNVAVEIEPKQIKDWLLALDVEPGTRGKYKSVMGGVYNFAKGEGILPLGDERSNPVSFVRIEVASDYEAVTLAPEQTMKVLQQCKARWLYALVLLVAVTGLRINEALGLRWHDIVWDRREIKIRRGFVHGVLQDGCKTRASRATVPLHDVLAEVLRAWQQQTQYAKPNDFVWASEKLHGTQPRTGSMVVEDYLHPAAVSAGVIVDTEDGRMLDSEGNEITRFGFHNFRHRLTSLLMSEGENPKVIQSLLRWSNMDMALYYNHSSKNEKLEVQGKVLERLRAATEAIQ